MHSQRSLCTVAQRQKKLYFNWFLSLFLFSLSSSHSFFILHRTQTQHFSSLSFFYFFFASSSSHFFSIFSFYITFLLSSSLNPTFLFSPPFLFLSSSNPSPHISPYPPSYRRPKPQAIADTSPKMPPTQA